MMKSRSFNILVVFALLLSLLGGAVTVTPAYAAGIVVNTNADNTTSADSFCTLREAINNANSDSDTTSGDCAAGSGADTITFAANYTITLSGNQLPAVNTTITITGNGAANTIIDGANLYRIFSVSASGNLALNGLTARNARNFIYGGGAYNLGTLAVSDCVFSNNEAVSMVLGGFGLGGGIHNDGGILTVANSVFSSNRGAGGGGIFNNGTLTVTNSVFSGNIAASEPGGGIFNYDGATLIVANSVFSGNSGSAGGGMYNQGTLTSLNNTLSGNIASATGAVGGGLFNSSPGTLNYANTIIANSVNGDCGNFGTLGTNKNNLVEDGSCSAQFSGDPLLSPLADNGGKTQTMALLPGSPATDAGDNATCAASPVNGLDQRGEPRPEGSYCDIGSYEIKGGIPLVTATNPSANAVLTSLSSITVVFNQDMLNDGSSKAANNTANYILVERGTNASFDTTSCKGGVVSDDVQQTISSASYNSAGFVTSLTLASPLTAGTYRLFVCGTTSIWSAAGLELNNGASDYTVDFTIGAATGTGGSGNGNRNVSTSASALPKTGFAPKTITTLPPQPATLAYAKLGDLWLEIPSLNVKSSIVGVPQNANKTWDVTWLGNDTGWLNGTAFPTWMGNSVLTAHVTNASGLDGPFAALKTLKYGDQIIVHLGGVQYIYEVRETKLSRPYSTNYAFESKQDASYLTLITCQGYNPLNESYLFRRVVRAVLVSTLSE